jgi:hypothetical protein
VFGNLNKVQETLLGEDIAESIGETAPMARWHTLVQGRWAGDSPTSVSKSYGSQQYGESEFAITNYRDAFGNGDAVTDFQAIETAALPISVTELLSNLSEMDQSEAAEIKIPKAPNSGVPLPVFVESEAEYQRAKGLLEEFPERPPTKIELSGESGGSKPEPPEGQDEGEEDPEPSGDLTELGGITPSIAAALRSAGYESKKDLKEADKEELMQTEGIESQQANRIKLLVGG